MEPAVPDQPTFMSEAEYLQFEEAAETKHEFFNGMVIDMAGSTTDHVRISSNITSELHYRLKGSPCGSYNSDLRVRVKQTGRYCYPDVTVVCGPVKYALPGRKTTITNPQIVVEVLSPSSEWRDRHDKFDDYRRLPSLQEYFLVLQDKAYVYSFYRQVDGIWAFGPSYTKMDELVVFRSLSVQIPMSDIYAGITLPEPPVLQPDPEATV